jgi:hypothetical protein
VKNGSPLSGKPNLEKTSFRNTSFPVMGWMTIALLLVMGIVIIAKNGLAITDFVALALWLSSIIPLRTLVRIQVITSTVGITIVNPLSTKTVPWPQLSDVNSSGMVLQISTTDGQRINCWAVERAEITTYTRGHSFMDDVARDLLAQRSAHQDSD